MHALRARGDRERGETHAVWAATGRARQRGRESRGRLTSSQSASMTPDRQLASCTALVVLRARRLYSSVRALRCCQESGLGCMWYGHQLLSDKYCVHATASSPWG